MRFFEDCRAEIYWHGAKLRRDKKTGRRLWGLTIIITLTYILTLDNEADEVVLGGV